MTALHSQTSTRSTFNRTPPLVLASYQAKAVATLAAEIGKTQREIARAPARRSEIGRAHGCLLLTAPTGSGKTLMIGRTLESLTLEATSIAAGFKGTLWLWFAPYSGLVTQTQTALRKDCQGLRPRDIMADREPSLTNAGDVFVTTWASVATNNRESRRLRRSGERALSLDDMIAELRDNGWFIGCVIDEAHVNFGMNAKSAAAFYLQHLKPDITILATATPKDRELASFMKAAGIGAPSRIQVSREDVVDAGLNKKGLVAAALALNEEQRLAIDADATILRAAWTHHCKIRGRLEERRIPLTPLLLVQVDNQSGKGTDPAGAALDMLKSVGVSPTVVRTHTSGNPDKAFHDLANDEDCEVLIFKVAAATGFDAPRAWTLASLRPSVSPEFGLQVVGRVMRVHPLVRPIQGQDYLLDRAQVFISDPKRQAGLEAAADILLALKSSVETVSDQSSFFAYGDTNTPPALRPAPGSMTVFNATATATGNPVDSLATTFSQVADTYCLQQERSASGVACDYDLFGMPIESEKVPHLVSRQGFEMYRLRQDLGLPIRLRTERLPEPSELPHLARAAADEFVIDDRVISLLHKKGVDAELRLRELLLSHQERSETIVALLSPARLAKAAQLSFEFNEIIDPREFRSQLIDRFRRELESRGSFDTPRELLGRVIDQIAVYEPERLRSATRAACGRFTRSVDAEPIPDFIEDKQGLFEARRAAFGVFPSKMNSHERAFAEFIDNAKGVRWWLRNPDHPSCKWAVRIVLATGQGFYPDFIVAVDGRKSLDDIRLAEIKDDGTDGRLNAQLNLWKEMAKHKDYHDVLWVTKSEGEGRLERLSYSEDQGRIVSRGRLLDSDLANSR